MASGRRSVHGGPVNAKNEAPAVGAKAQAAKTTTTAPEPPKQERVRVWWEPTDDKTRTGFGGAYWPAKVLSTKKGTIRVRYDNGEEQNVDPEHVSPLEAPVEFGQEKTQLQRGEFCEVHNASITDPGAWLGKVVKYDSEKDMYTVDYPFHDSKSEKIKADRVRRARVIEDDEWRLIRPNQEWEDGDVASPKELELIAEDELDQFLEGDGGSKKAAKKKRPSKAAEASNGKPAKAAKTESGSSSKAPVPAGMVAVQLKLFSLPAGGYCFVPVGSSSSSRETFRAFLPTKAMDKYNEGLPASGPSS